MAWKFDNPWGGGNAQNTWDIQGQEAEKVLQLQNKEIPISSTADKTGKDFIGFWIKTNSDKETKYVQYKNGKLYIETNKSLYNEETEYKGGDDFALEVLTMLNYLQKGLKIFNQTVDDVKISYIQGNKTESELKSVDTFSIASYTEQAIKKGDKIGNIIDEIANHVLYGVLIKYQNMTGVYRTQTQNIPYSGKFGLKVNEFIKNTNDNKGYWKEGYQSPAVGFFHELGHAYIHLKVLEQNKINDSALATYLDKVTEIEHEEQWIVDNLESPLALLLDGEGIRTQYIGNDISFKAGCSICPYPKSK